MAFFNKIRRNNKIGVHKSCSANKNEKSSSGLFNKIIPKCPKSTKDKSDKSDKPDRNKEISHNTTTNNSSLSKKKISKDDLTVTIPSSISSEETVKFRPRSRSRSHSISYDLSSITYNSNFAPDKKTWKPVKNINIKANIFWGEEFKKEQVNLSIPRTSSYDSFRKALSEKLGYEIPQDSAILYHTRKYHKNSIVKRILLDYWIKNKILWLVDNDFTFRKHMLLWRDNIEVTVVRTSIIY